MKEYLTNNSKYIFLFKNFYVTLQYQITSDMTIKQHLALYGLRTLIVKYGYWSEEVKEFNSKLDYETMTIINNVIKNEE